MPNEKSYYEEIIRHDEQIKSLFCSVNRVDLKIEKEIVIMNDKIDKLTQASNKFMYSAFVVILAAIVNIAVGVIK